MRCRKRNMKKTRNRDANEKEMRKKREGDVCLRKVSVDLDLAALFGFVQRGEEVSLSPYLVLVSLHGAATSFNLMRYAHLPHCILWNVLNAAGMQQRGRWRECVYRGGKHGVCVCVCTCSLQMPRHPACLHPSSPWLRWV